MKNIQRLKSWPLLLLAIVITVFSVQWLNIILAQERPTLTPEQFARVQIHGVANKPGLYVIPGFDGGLSGGNVAVRVTDEGVIVVDNKFEYSHADILRQIATVTTQPVRYVLNTHHHFDHAGSNADFMPDAQVVGHKNVRVNMNRNNQPGAPNIQFDSAASVFLGDVEAQAYHFGRGHTNGDSVILFPDLLTVHTGDLFIWGDRLDGSTLAPFIDYANGGSAADWTATLDGLLTLDFDTVIPGHGPILGRSDIRVFRGKFDQLLTRVRMHIDEGVSREAIADELDIEDLNWPLAPDRIQAIYDELSSN
jgi:glyoxylase-like metal-dependent hydrolase (beta-lactamase superfamily II)